MPTIEDLRLRTGQLCTEDWYDNLCSILGQLAYEGVVNIYGYVANDLIPVADLLINLGISIKKFKEVHCGTVYASGNILINGHPVIKDGDPITVSDFGASAESDLVTAVEDGVSASTVAKDTSLTGFRDRFIPTKLGSKWEQAVTAMTEIFSPDLTVSNSGRIRVKMKIDYPAYAYINHKLTGEATEVLAMLNAGISLLADAWYEFDFTSLQNDTLNLMIDQSTNVTIIVYNITNA